MDITIISDDRHNILGTIFSLGIAYLIDLPCNLTPNEQILIRTAPDLRDLGIAILAGAAGSMDTTVNILPYLQVLLSLKL
jgi:uncharacterized membrane protein